MDAEDQSESDVAPALQKELLKLTGMVSPEDPCRACFSSPLQALSPPRLGSPNSRAQHSGPSTVRSHLQVYSLCFQTWATEIERKRKEQSTQGNEKNSLLDWVAENDARYRASLDSALKGAWASKGPGSAVAGGS